MEESLLNIELFVYFIEKLSKFLNILKVETVTNGTVLNHRVKHMLNKFHPFLTISLDGPEVVHDRLRGKGSHRKTLRFIKYLKVLIMIISKLHQRILVFIKKWY